MSIRYEKMTDAQHERIVRAVRWANSETEIPIPKLEQLALKLHKEEGLNKNHLGDAVLAGWLIGYYEAKKE